MALRQGILLLQDGPSKCWAEQYVVLHYNSLLIYEDAEALTRGTPLHWTSLQHLCVSVADTDDKRTITTTNGRVYYIKLNNANRKLCILLGSRSELARNEWFASILMVLTRDLLRQRDSLQDASPGSELIDVPAQQERRGSNSGRRRSLSLDGAVESTIKFLTSMPKKLHLPKRHRTASCPVDPDKLLTKKDCGAETHFYRCTSQDVFNEE